jgi:intracellular sulfur oxidation DsrE/DsrF family protein
VNRDPTDARLNALIDGELAPAEAVALLEQLRAEPALLERWSQLRLTKELVRHACRDAASAPRPPRPSSEARVGGGRQVRRALVALSLLGGAAAAGWLLRRPSEREHDRLAGAPAVPSGAGAPTHRIVLHLSSNAIGQEAATLERAEGLIQAARDAGSDIAVEIVANGSGLDLLRVAASRHAQRIAALQASYPTLSLVACGQTVQRLRETGADVQLIPGTVVASSALDQIVQRLQQGWVYVRV